MLDKKNFLKPLVGLLLLLAAGLTGCTPTGPAALKKGIALLDAGDNQAACDQLKLAVTLLKTNAIAWNDYGIAAQRAGQSVDAANAYLRALELDRDLVEAHCNLGCLYLEQNQPDSARSEFASYTLRRPNDPEGWRKLGSAQLRLGETADAQRSFSHVIHLSPGEQDAEAYNGLGIAFLQVSQPRNAVRYFAAAIQIRPDYANALLNLAVTSQQYLRDNRAALLYYQRYLALNPRPANWDEVNAIAMGIAQAAAAPVAPAAALAPATPPATTAAVSADSAPPRFVVPLRPNRPVTPPTNFAATPQSPAVAVRPVTTTVVRPAISAAPTATVTQRIVHLPPEPVINPAGRSAVATADNPVEVSPPPAKTGFWQHLNPSKWFSDDTASNSAGPAASQPPASTTAAAANFTPFTPYYSRYDYTYPPKPTPGDRRTADGAFTKARLYEQDEKWSDAMIWYSHAADYDPAWFEAQYKTALLAERARNYARSLKSYERALALKPDSEETRYHFALALKAAYHPHDAIDQLNKILVNHPNDPAIHFALAGVYAESLQDAAHARLEYRKVLALAPNHPQAAEIRAWLRTN